MELILISAMTRDRIIGRASGLPWDLPDEYAHFLAQVRGHPVIFGRRSWEIFGGDLPDSPKIVVSRSARDLPGAEIAGGVEEAIERARRHGDRVFCAGGATLYAQCLSRATAMYLSFVKEDHDGDTRFPEFDPGAWTIAKVEDHGAWEFRVYTR